MQRVASRSAIDLEDTPSAVSPTIPKREREDPYNQPKSEKPPPEELDKAYGSQVSWIKRSARGTSRPEAEVSDGIVLDSMAMGQHITFDSSRITRERKRHR